jgi:hypothetical protein
MSKIKITDPGVDQHEAARAHAQAQEQAVNNLMKNQTRRMGATENTAGTAMPRLGK